MLRHTFSQWLISHWSGRTLTGMGSWLWRWKHLQHDNEFYIYISFIYKSFISLFLSKAEQSWAHSPAAVFYQCFGRVCWSLLGVGKRSLLLEVWGERLIRLQFLVWRESCDSFIWCLIIWWPPETSRSPASRYVSRIFFLHHVLHSVSDMVPTLHSWCQIRPQLYFATKRSGEIALNILVTETFHVSTCLLNA